MVQIGLRALLVIASVFNATLVRWLLPTLGAAVLAQVLFAAALLCWMPSGNDTMVAPLELKNPFDLTVVLGFGAILTAIMVLAKAFTVWTGATAVMALAAVSSLAEADAITLSIARLGRTDLSAETAALAILVALGVNSASKQSSRRWPVAARLVSWLLSAPPLRLLQDLPVFGLLQVGISAR